jgi:hypothetical protein
VIQSGISKSVSKHLPDFQASPLIFKPKRYGAKKDY